MITYLIKDGLPKEKGNPSFLYLFGINCVNRKMEIYKYRGLVGGIKIENRRIIESNKRK